MLTGQSFILMKAVSLTICHVNRAICWWESRASVARGRINVIGALLASCLLTVSLFTGAINANTFYAWIVQDWLLQRPPHSVVVMDNKRADIRQLFEQAGPVLEYLPTYSPDLNPIEHKWAQAKAIRRRNHCSIESLFAYFVS